MAIQGTMENWAPNDWEVGEARTFIASHRKYIQV